MISQKKERQITKDKIHNFTVTVGLGVLASVDNSSYPGCSESEYFQHIAHFNKDYYINSNGLLFYEVFDEF